MDMIYDLLIIGSGPAGLSAAVYGKRAGLNLLVLEGSAMSGGQVLTTYEVDNYLGLPGSNGYDMGQIFRAHADKLGVCFENKQIKTLMKEADGTFLATGRKAEYRAKSVIVATGAEHAKLDVPGESDYSGMGVSYCATCDGAFYKDKTVAVVGGGDVALEDAIYLARTCKKVYLIHRRDSFRGAQILQDRLLTLENVELLYNTRVTEIKGDLQQVRGVVISTSFVGADGTSDAVTSERELELDGVFIAVGIHPNNGLVSELVSTDEGGYVPADETGATEIPGLFVAGDLRKKPLRQIVTAVADGANAATAATEYLRKL